MRRAVRSWALLATLAAFAWGATAAAAPTPRPAPSLHVDPARDLRDGTVVTITASGLTPNAWVDAAQCISSPEPPAPGVDGRDRCDATDRAMVRTDTAGRATLRLRVDAVMTIGSTEEESYRTADCRPDGSCAIVVFDDGGWTVGAPIDFDANAPLAPPPTLTVTPPDQLQDQQSVTVEGSGLVWAGQADLFQCAADPVSQVDCDFTTLVTVDTTASPSFRQDYRVSRVIEIEGRGTVDCRPPGSCVLVVASDIFFSPSRTAIAPLDFDPTGELVGPRLRLDPDRDLVDEQTVTVTGSGFRPGIMVHLMLCGPQVSWESCQGLIADVNADATGSFRWDLEVLAVLSTSSDEDIDCRSSPRPCQIIATPGEPGSVRAARAPLHFAPDAPLAPGPVIDVRPATDLPGEATVTVAGRGLEPHDFADLGVCQVASFDLCDPQAHASVTADAAGRFTVELPVTAHFQAWEDGPWVDCRVAPGCEVVADSFGARPRRTSAALSFVPPADAGSRYREPVFDEVAVTRDVVYRETVDSQGRQVRLELDIYEPAGDTSARRPAVVWMPGGWFSPETTETWSDMVTYAEAFARRGYVAVIMEYRLRPELQCCPTDDVLGLTAALHDGHEDAVAGLRWLHHHAARWRIDPRAIAVGGAAAGAANAFGLVYPPDEASASATPTIAAALPISGVSLGRPVAGAPPVLAFHGREDAKAPLHLTERTCAAAAPAGAHCEVVGYDGVGADIVLGKRRDIVRRSAGFLADEVLRPLGYRIEPLQRPSPPSPPAMSGPAAPTTPDSARDGSLARTGSNATRPLVRAGLGLAALGGGLVTLARYRSWRAGRAGLRGSGEDGRSNLAGALALAGLAVVLLAACILPGRAGGLELAAGQPGDDPTTTTDTSVPDPGATTTTSVETTSTTSTTEATTGTTEATPTSEATEAGLPGGSPELPPEWTPEQRAFAERLIQETVAALPRYRNPAILPLLGYVLLLGGPEAGQYEQWINLQWLDDQHTLTPAWPESLVFRRTESGSVLEAAQFILPSGYTMETIPDEVAWLPGWRSRGELCSSGGPVIRQASNGVCDQGHLVATPPSLHVWTVDTPCGRFACT